MNKKHPIGKRHLAREIAVRLLYQAEMGDVSPTQVFAAFDLGEFLAESRPTEKLGREDAAERRLVAEQSLQYARRLVEGTLEHRDEIDRLIREQADNWRLERMPAVDRNLLRLAVYEIVHERDVPDLVVVDEAIELAKRYGSEHSGRFVNGLLDGLLRRQAIAKQGSEKPESELEKPAMAKPGTEKKASP